MKIPAQLYFLSRMAEAGSILQHSEKEVDYTLFDIRGGTKICWNNYVKLLFIGRNNYLHDVRASGHIRNILPDIDNLPCLILFGKYEI